MALQTFTKQPYEKYKIAIEWSGKLPTGGILSSCDVSAVKTSDSSNASSDVLESTTGEISGTQSRVIVKAGVDQQSYKITFRVVLADGTQLEEDLLMTVAEQ